MEIFGLLAIYFLFKFLYGVWKTGKEEKAKLAAIDINDNPTIVLLQYRSNNNTKVEYAIRGITQPLCVEEYNTCQMMEDLKLSLPQ